MDNSSQYIESISLEILDRSVLILILFSIYIKKIYFRPHLWLEKDDLHKFNIETFNTRKAALAFLQQYKGWTLFKAQKVNNIFFFVILLYKEIA